ncbi:ribosomal protein L7/L12 [Pseudomonas leptonychotis]|uniref:ribosomal protein L7/L12 n=1 Tax=Pseudomonas leptonychotis TaxID=2448482 RepID=UPI0039EF7DD1
MAELNQDLPPQVVAALQRGQKIEAVKLLRELRGIGLKETKDAVDNCPLERQVVDGAVVQPGGHGVFFWLLGLFVLGGVVAWLFGKF